MQEAHHPAAARLVGVAVGVGVGSTARASAGVGVGVRSRLRDRVRWPRRTARGGGAVQLAQGADRGGQGPTAVVTAAQTADSATAKAAAAVAAFRAATDVKGWGPWEAK